MIDLRTETPVTLAQASRLWASGRDGRPAHPSAVFRWIVRGVRGHKLDAVRLGGKTFTTAEALQRFAAALGGGVALGDKSCTRPLAS